MHNTANRSRPSPTNPKILFFLYSRLLQHVPHRAKQRSTLPIRRFSRCSTHPAAEIEQLAPRNSLRHRTDSSPQGKPQYNREAPRISICAKKFEKFCVAILFCRIFVSFCLVLSLDSFLRLLDIFYMKSGNSDNSALLDLVEKGTDKKGRGANDITWGVGERKKPEKGKRGQGLGKDGARSFSGRRRGPSADCRRSRAAAGTAGSHSRAAPAAAGSCRPGSSGRRGRRPASARW